MTATSRGTAGTGTERGVRGARTAETGTKTGTVASIAGTGRAETGTDVDTAEHVHKQRQAQWKKGPG